MSADQASPSLEDPARAANSKAVSTPSPPTHQAEGSTSPKGKASSPRSSAGSPEPNCSICLSKIVNKSFTDSCFHTFCFVCLVEWAKVKAVCPLCKAPFKSIIHNVRSIEDYDQYHLRPQDTTTHAASPWALDASDAQRFRYRTTMTFDRSRLSFDPYGFHPYFALRSGPTRVPTHTVGQGTTTRSQWRNRRQAATSQFRRSIYDSGFRVVSNSTGRRTRQRDISPAFFTRNEACTHRLVPWLNRELNVLLTSRTESVGFVLELIIDLIKRFEIDSEEFYEHIQPYIQSRTSHFIHEFMAFARSPHDMIAYDRHAQYEPHEDPLTRLVADVNDDASSSDGSVIVLSEREGDQDERDENQNATSTLQSLLDSEPVEPPLAAHDVSPLLDRVRSFLSSLNDTAHSGWNSPTPGPSSLMFAPAPSTPPNDHGPFPITRVKTEKRKKNESTAVSDSNDNDTDDCVITGYEKPWAERTPITLTSASEAEEAKPKIKKEKKDKKKKRSSRKDSSPTRHSRNRSRSRSFSPSKSTKSRSSKSTRRAKSRSGDQMSCSSSHSRSKRSHRRSRSKSRDRRSGSEGHSVSQRRRHGSSKSKGRSRSPSRERSKSSRGSSHQTSRRRSRSRERSHSHWKRARSSSRSRSRDDYHSHHRKSHHHDRKERSGNSASRSPSKKSKRSRHDYSDAGSGHSSRSRKNKSQHKNKELRSCSKSPHHNKHKSDKLSATESKSHSKKTNKKRKDRSPSVEILFETVSSKSKHKKHKTGEKHHKKKHHSKSRHGRNYSDNDIEVLEEGSRDKDEAARPSSQSEQNDDNDKKCKKHPTGHKSTVHKSSGSQNSGSGPSGSVPMAEAPNQSSESIESIVGSILNHVLESVSVAVEAAPEVLSYTTKPGLGIAAEAVVTSRVIEEVIPQQEKDPLENEMEEMKKDGDEKDKKDKDDKDENAKSPEVNSVHVQDSDNDSVQEEKLRNRASADAFAEFPTIDMPEALDLTTPKDDSMELQIHPPSRNLILDLSRAKESSSRADGGSNSSDVQECVAPWLRACNSSSYSVSSEGTPSLPHIEKPAADGVPRAKKALHVDTSDCGYEGDCSDNSPGRATSLSASGSNTSVKIYRKTQKKNKQRTISESTESSEDAPSLKPSEESNSDIEITGVNMNESGSDNSILEIFSVHPSSHSSDIEVISSTPAPDAGPVFPGMIPNPYLLSVPPAFQVQAGPSGSARTSGNQVFAVNSDITSSTDDYEFPTSATPQAVLPSVHNLLKEPTVTQVGSVTPPKEERRDLGVGDTTCSSSSDGGWALPRLTIGEGLFEDINVRPVDDEQNASNLGPGSSQANNDESSTEIMIVASRGRCEDDFSHSPRNRESHFEKLDFSRFSQQETEPKEAQKNISLSEQQHQSLSDYLSSSECNSIPTPLERDNENNVGFINNNTISLEENSRHAAEKIVNDSASLNIQQEASLSSSNTQDYGLAINDSRESNPQFSFFSSSSRTGPSVSVLPNESNLINFDLDSSGEESCSVAVPNTRPSSSNRDSVSLNAVTCISSEKDEVPTASLDVSVVQSDSTLTPIIIQPSAIESSSTGLNKDDSEGPSDTLSLLPVQVNQDVSVTNELSQVSYHKPISLPSEQSESSEIPIPLNNQHVLSESQPTVISTENPNVQDNLGSPASQIEPISSPVGQRETSEIPTHFSDQHLSNDTQSEVSMRENPSESVHSITGDEPLTVSVNDSTCTILETTNLSSNEANSCQDNGSDIEQRIADVIGSSPSCLSGTNNTLAATSLDTATNLDQLEEQIRHNIVSRMYKKTADDDSAGKSTSGSASASEASSGDD